MADDTADVARSARDWGDKRWRDTIDCWRAVLWRTDSFPRVAEWMGMRPGISVVDVGCGLGFLGQTFWPFFGEGGSYLGIDLSDKLLDEAREAAGGWAQGGSATFQQGDATGLPLADDSADLVMCQTLLMHLPRPEEALREMIRVARPGGFVVCAEPDNLANNLLRPAWSVPHPSIDDQVFRRRCHLLINAGRIALGLGDWSIGSKVPHMMAEHGLRHVDARLNDRLALVEPPYDDPGQRQTVFGLIKQSADREKRQLLDALQDEALRAGGGSDEDVARLKALQDTIAAQVAEQLGKGAFHMCWPSVFVVTRGEKVTSGATSP